MIYIVGGLPSEQNRKLPQEQALIDKLIPPDIFKIILFYVDDNQNAMLVNKYWQMSIINIKTKEYILFLNVLRGQISKVKYPDQEKALLKLGGQDQELNFKLPSIRAFPEELMNKASEILKDLAIEDLENLEKLYKAKAIPKPFDKVFISAKADKAISEIESNCDPLQYAVRIIPSFKALIENDMFVKTKEMFAKMPERSLACNTLDLFFEQYFKYEQLDKAEEVMNIMPPERQQSCRVRLISQYLLTSQLDKVLALGIQFPDSSQRKSTFKAAIQECENLIHNAKMMAKRISDDSQRKSHLAPIFEKYKDKLDKAASIAKLIKYPEEKSFVLNLIAKAFLDTDMPEKAVEPTLN